MDTRLSAQDVWISTLLFAVTSLVLVIPLHTLTHGGKLGNMDLPILVGSAIFWGAMSALVIRRFWDVYYCYFYPEWIRSLWPLSPVLYLVIGVGSWRLAPTFKIPGLLAFCLIGGLEGVAEHILAVYAFKVLEKVPFLQGLKPIPVLIFSFFEYVCYWAIVGWVALGVGRLLPLLQ